IRIALMRLSPRRAPPGKAARTQKAFKIALDVFGGVIDLDRRGGIGPARKQLIGRVAEKYHVSEAVVKRAWKQHRPLLINMLRSAARSAALAVRQHLQAQKTTKN